MHYLNKQNKDDTVKSTKQTPSRDKMHDGEKYRHILVKIAGNTALDIMPLYYMDRIFMCDKVTDRIP